MDQTVWQICREKNIFIFLPSIKSLNNKYPWSSLQIWRNDFFLFYQAKKNSLSILGLLCRIEEININIYIILPSIKKSLNKLGLLYRFEEINILPSIKNSLDILGLLYRVEINKYFNHYTKHKKKLLKCTGSSLQIWIFFFYSTKKKKPPWISWVFFFKLKK